MEFRIEASKPTKPADLKTVLSAERDRWLEETDQIHEVGSPEDVALNNSRNNREDLARLNDETKPKTVAMYQQAVQAHRDLVKAQSSKPSARCAGALELIATGIDAAVAVAARFKTPVRVSVVGHYDVSTDGIRVRPAENVTVQVNSAG